jgi:tetratricopeptide (TPR) repeat protein
MATPPEKPTDDAPADDVKLDFKRIPGTSLYEVTLPDGRKVKVERTRTRMTPGLGGLGPSTGALYDLAIEELGAAICQGTVVDLGAGCGIGSRRIARHVGNLVAVEIDSNASALADAFLAQATVIEAPIEAVRLDAPADGALMIDVLGFLDNPLQALRGARRVLRKGGRLVVIEPLAFPSQSLVPPARRACAPGQLGAMLETVGFTLTRCASDGGVVIATAEAIVDPHVDTLAEGAEACARGDLDRALELFDRVAREATHNIAVQAALDAVDVLVAQGRADDACGRLLAVLRRFPEEPRPLAALSQFMVAAGEPAEARMLAEKAARLAPLEAAVIAGLAIALQVNRDPDATAAWRKAYNLAPDALEIALPAATNALETGHPLLAERMLSRCMTYDGNARPEAFVARARVRIALGRTEDAKLDARLASNADPSNEEAKALVASLESSSAA